MADFKVTFAADGGSMAVTFGQAQPVPEFVGGEIYDGPYQVTPKVTAQTIPTKDRVLLEDVTILEVPVYRVSNNSGGTTVYIAKEV